MWIYFPTLGTSTNVFSGTCNILYSVQFKVEQFREPPNPLIEGALTIYILEDFFKSWDCNECKSVHICIYTHIHTYLFI